MLLFVLIGSSGAEPGAVIGGECVVAFESSFESRVRDVVGPDAEVVSDGGQGDVPRNKLDSTP
jgi:hypothetical protein